MLMVECTQRHYNVHVNKPSMVIRTLVHHSRARRTNLYDRQLDVSWTTAQPIKLKLLSQMPMYTLALASHIKQPSVAGPVTLLEVR